MAKRKAAARSRRAAASRKKAAPRKSRKAARRPVGAGARKAAKRARKAASKPRRTARGRRADEVVPTPPSSLNMNRRGSAVRSGRAELAAARARQRSLSPELAGGDADADLESAYFTGDESAGGDNPTPDQDVVEDIGRAVGVEYQDNEELGTTDKVSQRDRHRWELDPASSEDYKDRK